MALSSTLTTAQIIPGTELDDFYIFYLGPMSPTLLYMCWKLGPMAMIVIRFIEISLVMTSLMLFLHICVYNSSS